VADILSNLSNSL